MGSYYLLLFLFVMTYRRQCYLWAVWIRNATGVEPR